MRKRLLLPLLLCSGCSHVAQDAWTGQDKAQHFFGSAMLSVAGNEYGQKQGWSQGRSNSVGLMFALSLGTAKEWYDSRPAGSGWSWKDLTWDVAGAAAGYALWNLGQ
ncbi:YfiM family lipoprotein [Paramixta manurensis]|uniref:YfiM family lipoprotein n=1 Tax=Paramixta manurensis TaxID=2740817 RepID=A0A6M8UHG7_9GAMM|nr:YfiM family lipoprotein [Erwiniaceae bacterium PD-1]